MLSTPNLKNCVVCSKSFSPVKGTVKCCSFACGRKSMRSFKGANNPAWTGGFPKCIECGIRVKNRYAKRCSTHRGTTLKGKNNPNWKGGVISKNEIFRQQPEYKVWRRAIFKRDNYTCQWCGVKNTKGLGKTVILNADHIKPLALYPELRLNINNGRTLCEDCHKKTPTYAGKMWKYATTSTKI